MAPKSDYVTGTITLTNGSANFTGAGTGWLLAGFLEGDTIIDVTGATEFMGVIASIDANGAGTLTKPWEGPTVTSAYRMRYQPDGTRQTAQARQLIELLGDGTLQSLAGLTGPGVIELTIGGGAQVVPKTDLISGAAYDVQVADLPARAAYDGQAAGYAVLVANTGDGRSAIYSKVSNASGDWTVPAYVTGPSITLDVTEVDEVPYGTPPDVNMTPRAGGYDLAFDIPRGMIIEPGTTTTLAPDQPAAVTFVPVTGGYRLDIAIPRGPTGDIDGVTPFWVSRLGADADAASARLGLGVSSVGEAVLTAPDAAAARAGLGAGVVDTLVAGDGIEIDNTDPTSPVISALAQESFLQSANIFQITGTLKHKGLTSQIFPVPHTGGLGIKKWVIIWREAVSHYYDGNSVLKAADSYDQGKSLQNIRIIHNEPSVDVRDFSGGIMTGVGGVPRIALLATRTTGVGAFGRPVFIFSDDFGATWSSGIVASLPTGFAPDEYLHNIPASAGGNADTFICYAASDPLRQDITYAKTTNNGTTWTTGVAVAPIPGEDWSEPRVVRLGSENKWLMVIRRNQSEGLNAYIARSTDLMTWTAAVDSGQKMGRNPAALWCDDGKVYWFAFSRPYADPAMSIEGRRDSLLVQSMDAADLWSDLGGWSGWTTFANMWRPLGYLKFVRDSGKTYGIFAYNEYEVGDGASYTALAIISDDPGVTSPIADSGGGTNGRWVAYTDGRLECWGTVSTTITCTGYAGVFLSEDKSIPFPSNGGFAFADAPASTVRTVSSSARAWPVNASDHPANVLTHLGTQWVSPVATTAGQLTYSYRTVGYWS